MNNNSLNAISPIDGRYASKTSELNEFFSEKALMKYRLIVEIEYFISLCKFKIPELNEFDKTKFRLLREIYHNFSDEDAMKIKEIEKATNHDVKAVEYFLKEKFSELKIEKYKEFVHFGLTSQDINNTAIPLSLKEMFDKVYFNSLEKLLKSLEKISIEWKDISMIARTHGQAATPTKLGKEIKVFVVRINEQLNHLKNLPISAKFGGASGNFNAHHVAYKNYDWLKFSKNLVERKLGLKHSFPTTQIEHYDNLAAIFDNMKRINTILIDFNKDIWSYISMDYFKQKIKKGEIGSSAMPHKINPIDFENSEGNLGYANSIFNHLSEKLPISRLQRDLTDSTVLRNIGVPISHTLIAFKSTIKGINKLIVNKTKIKKDLDNNWAVIAEAIQTILRRINYPDPYEDLKDLTRTNEKIDKNSIHKFIDSLKIEKSIKTELKNITPENFTGIH
tara:strand:- start:372 stop:1718 length:1347 start_codon:yes stop_codon:yes gene_type:complete